MPQISLRVLDRNYLFNYTDEEDGDLLRAAADLINQRAQRFREADPALTSERLAVSAAIDIAFSSLSGRLGVDSEEEECAARARALNSRLLAVLARADAAS